MPTALSRLFFSFGMPMTRGAKLLCPAWIGRGRERASQPKGFSRLQQSFFWDIPFSAMANPVDGAARRLSAIGSPSLITGLIQFALVIRVIDYD